MLFTFERCGFLFFFMFSAPFQECIQQRNERVDGVTFLCCRSLIRVQADTVTFSSKRGAACGETTRQRLQSFLVTKSREGDSSKIHTDLSEFGRWLFDHLKKFDVGGHGAVFVLAADTGDVPLKLSHLLARDRGE